jgi:hypothetical protein
MNANPGDVCKFAKSALENTWRCTPDWRSVGLQGVQSPRHIPTGTVEHHEDL